MTERFQIQDDLPALNCTREHFYAMARSLLPTENLVDDDSILISAGQIQAGLTIPRWRKYTVDFSDVAVGSTSEQEVLFTLPAGGVVHAVKIKHSIAFEGTGITAVTASVGTTGDSDKFAAAFDVLQSVSDTALELTETPSAETHDSGGQSVVAEIVTTGADLNVLTAGSVDIYVLWSVALEE